jgi:hypothetical protein
MFRPKCGSKHAAIYCKDKIIIIIIIIIINACVHGNYIIICVLYKSSNIQLA